MCLDTVAEGKRAETIASKFQWVSTNICVGYKSVDVKGPQTFEPSCYCHPRMRLGWWHNAQNAAWGTKYPLGFHAFATLRAAQDWPSCGRIVKVHLRGDFTFGRQNGSPCIVASRQKIVAVVE